MVFGYAPVELGGMSYCNQIPFPLHETSLVLSPHREGGPGHFPPPHCLGMRLCVVQGWCVCVSCSTAVCGAGDLVKVYTWCEGGDGGGGGRSDVQHAV